MKASPRRVRQDVVTLFTPHKAEFDVVYTKSVVSYVRVDENYGIRQNQKGIETEDSILVVVDLNDLVIESEDGPIYDLDMLMNQLHIGTTIVKLGNHEDMDGDHYTLNKIVKLKPASHVPAFFGVVSKMTKSGIKVYFNVNKVVGDYEVKRDLAQQVLKQMVVEDTDPFVPFETGTLRHSVADSLTDNEPRIIYNTPYAHFLYRGLVMIDPKTKSPIARENATKIYKMPYQKLQFKKGMSEWFEHSKNLYKKRWIKEVRKVLTSK